MRYLCLLALLPSLVLADAVIDTGQGQLKLDDHGRVTALTVNGRDVRGPAGGPAIEVETDQGVLRPVSIQQQGNQLTVKLLGDGVLRCDLTRGDGFVVCKLTELKVPGEVTRLRLLALPIPKGGTHAGLMNGWYDDQSAMAVMSTAINVRGYYVSTPSVQSDKEGCSHQFERVTDPVKQGTGAVRFTATSTREDGAGWSSGRHNFSEPLDLTGMTALKAWVYGDGSGAMLKLQLRDAQGGARDDTLPLNFTGWKQFELSSPSYNTLRYGQVNSFDLYYNSMPAGKTCSVVVDQVEADVNGKVVPLADFDRPESSLWNSAPGGTRLVCESYRRHGILPAGVGVILCERSKLDQTIERFERAAGLPSPHPDGVWGKDSPAAKRSYMLAIFMKESDTDDVIAFAKRANLGTILIFEAGGMWCATTGHYLLNQDSWPRGLDSLKDTCDKIHAAGLKVGLHYLGASIYPPDPYVAPVPDRRLVTDVETLLAGDISATDNFIPTAEPPKEFPAKDVDYLGTGAVLRIGDELIHYGALSLEPPYGFSGCARGFHGTVAAAHAKGDVVAHMQRSYGYYLYDLDSTLRDEVADNVTRILNTCGVDMVYWDGSEQLQGDRADHWYYNAKLHQGFYSRLKNQDIICQGSSVSHYSWHIHSRLASADGHGDLKGYLDERSPRFKWYGDNLLPVDIGWYSVTNQSQPLDAYEYIAAKSVGYDASFSFGTVPKLFQTHPYLMAIADRLAVYEQARLGGHVPAETKAALRQPGHDYRLVKDGDRIAFQRVLFEPRHDVTFDGKGDTWTFEVKDQPCGIAAEVLTSTDRWAGAGPAYEAPEAVTLETFDTLQPYLGEADAGLDAMVIGDGKSGMCKEGVTQRLEWRPDGPAGKRYAQYTAVSTLAKADGWSAIGRSLDSVLDLSQCKGVGFWLKGDGHGSNFKLQLRDEVGAVDWYIPNNFVGWRYVQLDRATGQVYRDLDWSKISRIIYYYNGLPADSTVSVGIDDVKALMSLDTPVLDQPSLEIDGQRVTWPVKLTGSHRLFWWPGGPTKITGPGTEQTLPTTAPLVLQPGTHTVQFKCQGPASISVGVKLLLLPPERLDGGLAP